MPITSPLGSPRNTGFIPLNNTSSSRSNEMADNGIPLTQIKSHASSTGARKANQGFATITDRPGDSMDEKTGLFGRNAGRRKKQPEKLSRSDTASSDEFALNAMGRLYTKIIGFSVVTRYLVYVVPVALLLAVPLVVLPFVDPREEIRVGGFPQPLLPGPSLLRAFIWVEVSWLSLWVGKSVAWFLPSVFMFFCGVVSSGTRKYATVLRNLEIALSLFFWALASWLSFRELMDVSKLPVEFWTGTMSRVLGALFASSGVYLAEKAIVQLISISYHQRSFANRIKESKREVHFLGLLYDASRALFPMYCPEFSEEDYVINDSIDFMLGNGGKTNKNPMVPMRLIGDVGRLGDKVTSVFGNIASEITGKNVFNPNSAHSIVVEALEKVQSSEALAKRIWMSFVVEGKDALYPEDIEEVLGPANKEAADEAFDSIDTDQNGDISLDEMIRKVMEIGKERKAIAEGMKDIGQALKAFDEVLMFVVLLVVVFIFRKSQVFQLE
jgi:hypothetical protein